MGEREFHFPIGNNMYETLQLKMNVHTIEGLSGHSDRKQLLAFVGSLRCSCLCLCLLLKLNKISHILNRFV